MSRPFSVSRPAVTSEKPDAAVSDTAPDAAVSDAAVSANLSANLPIATRLMQRAVSADATTRQ